MGKIKFGIQNGLNVARAGYSEDQILTACALADRTGYDSVWYMDHTNVPQWKKAIVLDPWIMLPAIAASTRNVELGTCVTDAIRRHPSNIALAAITLDRVSKGRAILGIGAGEAQNLKEGRSRFKLFKSCMVHHQIIQLVLMASITN